MNTVVYSLQCQLVFGVPVLFGWALLRRVFREANWLALIPGAVVVGLAALMAAVNELRFFYDMRIAVWSAYKFLLALSLVLVVALPRRIPPPRLPGCVDRPWKLWLVIAGTVAVAFYYGIPAFQGYLNDAWWYHYPAAVQIQNLERFPLPNIFSLDDPLYYHHGPDILAACWSSLLDRPVQASFAINIVIFAPCAFLLSFALLSRLARNYWGALLGASFLIAGGNLRFLLLLSEKHQGVIGALQAFNSQSVQGLQQLMFTPSQALGIPLVLILLLLFRHISLRPSWLVLGVFGLLLGTVTLVAEWYFLPLLAGVTLCLLVPALKGRAPRANHWGWRVLPAAVAIAWGTFNHTYLGGIFGHFWLPSTTVQEVSGSRQFMAEFKAESAAALAALERLTPARETDQAGVRPSAPDRTRPSSAPPLEIDSTVPVESILPPGQAVEIFQPRWTVPNLVPLRLNLDHFGQVASWESAASSDSTFIPIFGSQFFMEVTPVMLFGLPFGVWLAWRKRSLTVLLLSWLAVSAVIPPIVFDWGYRSTDFLRFFTASFCFSALLFGWFVGELLSRLSLRLRLLGGVLAAGALITPISLGVIGLLPGTLSTVKQVADTARSLSQLEPTASINGPAEPPVMSRTVPSGVFEKLALETGNFLFPFTHGRDRGIVIVPRDQVPKVKYFPQWMKMATLSQLMLPTGWHWQESLYSAYYREAVMTLDPRAITSLDARWVIVSNVFQDRIPPRVATALADHSRFVPAATLREGSYFMIVFRIVP